MSDAITHFNWLAVIPATLAYYVLGAIWFTPLFGRAWDESLGFSRTRGHRFPPIYYVAPLIGSLLASIATAILVHALEVGGLPDAALLGLVLGIGYAGAISFTNAVTPNTPRPLLFAAVVGGYHLVGITLAAVVLVALR